jgi:hypothetical protein
VCRTVVAIGSYEGLSKKSESLEARYPDILLSDLRSAITTSRKSGKALKPVLDFRFCTPPLN